MKESPIKLNNEFPVVKITLAILVILNFTGDVQILWQHLILAGLLVTLLEIIRAVFILKLVKKFLGPILEDLY